MTSHVTFKVLLCHSQFKDNKLAKSRNFKSLRHKKDQTIQYVFSLVS